MNVRTFKKHHKWVGLILSVFLVVFAVSGIVLNHRGMVAGLDVSRRFLPSDYQFKDWNNGLIRGSVLLPDSDKVLAYGGAGLWLTDRQGKAWTSYNKGLPEGADGRGVRNVARLPHDEYFACTPFALYHQVGSAWQVVTLPLEDDHERLTDMAVKGDTLVVLSRSHLYWATAPYKNFKMVTLQPSKDHDPRASLFRTIWLLHSGEIFGLVGQLVVDVLGVILVLLVVTGIVHWFFPKRIRRLRECIDARKKATQQMQRNLWLHDRVGRYTLGAMLFIVFTGWCLRPPMLIAIAQGQVPVIPFSVLDKPGNAWHDRLRTLRYDVHTQTWLLHTSSGFYEMADFESVPTPIVQTPPTSVMGINAMAQRTDGVWLVGSFSGVYLWDRTKGSVLDYYTHQPPKEMSGPPVGQNTCSGYSSDFDKGELIFLHDKGNTAFAMPEEMRDLPMSVWNLALEAHTGRIYTFLGPGKHFVVFFIGLATLWCLWAGYRIRQRLRKEKKQKAE